MAAGSGSKYLETHDWYSRFYVTQREADWFENEIVSTHRVADWQAVGAFMIERLKLHFAL